MFSFLDPNKKTLKRLEKIADQVLSLSPKFHAMSDAELQAMTPHFKERIQAGETLDALLPEAFAVVRSFDPRHGTDPVPRPSHGSRRDP